MAGPNHEVFVLKRPETRKQLYPVFWDSEYFDLPIVEKRNQKRPAFNSETVTRLLSSAPWYVQIVSVLAAASGMRIGEVPGLEIDKHFADNFSAVLVRQKVRKCETENYSMVAWSRWEKHDGRILASQRRSEIPQIDRGTSGKWI